jgi:hypothetical protein
MLQQMFGCRISRLPVVDPDQIGPVASGSFRWPSIQQHHGNPRFLQSRKNAAIYFFRFALKLQRRKENPGYFSRDVLPAKPPRALRFAGLRIRVPPQKRMVPGIG